MSMEEKRIVHCWASLQEGLPDEDPRKWVGGDSLCLLEADHDGEHEWIPTSQIVVRFAE